MTDPTITAYPGDIPAKGQSNTVFDTNVDAYLVWLSTLNIPELQALVPFLVGLRDEVAATALSGTLPTMSGKAGDFFRVNAGETAVEFRTAAEVLGDIGAAALASPTGGVSYFAASSAPTGYLKANGATVSRSTYSALFAVVGEVYGAGDGSTTFEVPDLRGEFIRGFDDGRGIDAGRVFGSAQSWAIENITGGAGYFNSLAGVIFSGSLYQKSSTSTADSNNGGSTAYEIGLDASREVQTSTETRPRNVALLACIKF